MGPPNPCTTVVRFAAHALARALITLEGTPVFSDAHLGVLGTPSSSPKTYVREFLKTHAVGR